MILNLVGSPRSSPLPPGELECERCGSTYGTDRDKTMRILPRELKFRLINALLVPPALLILRLWVRTCLLYTSDAADE
mgnify:CR=1 FL=1